MVSVLKKFKNAKNSGFVVYGSSLLSFIADTFCYPKVISDSKEQQKAVPFIVVSELICDC